MDARAAKRYTYTTLREGVTHATPSRYGSTYRRCVNRNKGGCLSDDLVRCEPCNDMWCESDMRNCSECGEAMCLHCVGVGGTCEDCVRIAKIFKDWAPALSELAKS